MSVYKVITDLDLMDFELIYSVISETYWAKGIPAKTLKKALENSLCFAVINEENQQVGFARMITDKATYAYLADVFVLPEYQGLGLSKLMMSTITEHPELQGLRRMMLATRDAHGLYAKYGFTPIENPESLMQVWRPDVYK